MNNKAKILIVLLSGLLALAACDHSVSDPELNEINEVHFAGIDTAYTATLGEPFSIKPELTFTQDASSDTSRYTYEWFALSLASVLPGDRKKDLATTKNFTTDALTLQPSNYEVYYRVTDKETGVQWSHKFKLNVLSSIYQGWMLMTDVNGQAKLGMVSIKYNDDKEQVGHTDIPDVLAFTHSSLQLQGKPVDITCYTYDQTMYGIYVSSEGTGTTKIDPETFDWEPRYYLSYEIQGNVPEDFLADFIQEAGFTTSYMYADGNIYYYFRTFGINYGVPINKVSGEAETFKAAPYIGAGNGVSNYAPTILYDATNQRFLQHNYRNSSSVAELPEGKLFDYHTGKDLGYMTVNPYNGGQAFAILKAKDGTRYLARMAVTSAGVTQSYYDKITATDIKQAEHFAVSPVYGYIFYSVGGKVYEYDSSNKTTKLMLDKGSKDITVLRFASKLSFPMPDLANQLVVGVDDPSAPAESSGTLELYEVPPVHQQITLKNSYDGFGKIVDVDYRLRY